MNTKTVASTELINKASVRNTYSGAEGCACGCGGMIPIDFANVKIGDTIMERHSAKGLTHTRTGVVGAKTPKRLYTDQNEIIGWAGPQPCWPIWEEHQLFLVSRPVPVLPTVAPAKIENVRLEDSDEADYAILADDGWHCFTHSGIHFLAQEKDIISWDEPS